MPDNKLDYRSWLKKYNIQETPDYDTKSAWLSGMVPDARGHLKDTFKNTNHITYSDESLASKQPGAPPPGRWTGSDKDGWSFYASPTNIQNAGGVDKLQDYFKQYEPKSRLILPIQQPPLQSLLGPPQ